MPIDVTEFTGRGIVRWLISALSVVCLSSGAALLISLFAVSESASSERSREASPARAQYRSEDYSYYVQPPQSGTTAPFEAEGPETLGSVSEGSVSGASAPREALSIMEPPAPYSQVVDNASPGWFSGRGWEKSAGSKAQHYGRDYSYVEPSEAGPPALFRVNIPATDYYTVYARWPALKGNNVATRFGVSTPSGIEWIKVNQLRDGGMWVRLGAYMMEADNRYAVQVSGYRAKGRVVADAVMVVRGTQMVPPETDTSAGGQAGVQGVVQLAREHVGTPYIHSPPGSCEAHRSEDCSCLTSLVFAGFGITVPDDPVGQWSYGRYVAKSDLRPGDLVFFKENGPSYPISHVGIYSGKGNIIHASSYWGRVVERPMGYINGYYGAKRLGWNQKSTARSRSEEPYPAALEAGAFLGW
jgi:cell wall-associated NlpC family hydrolase